MKKVKAILIISVLSGFTTTITSCKKLVVVKPPTTSLTSDNIYSDDASAASVLTGVYTSLVTNSPLLVNSMNSIFLTAGLSSDELTLYGGASSANTILTQFYLNRLTAGLSTTSDQTIWSSLYTNLYTINIALEKLSLSTNLTPVIKQQLTGEAKFIRAFFYFYLINLYNDVPLATTSDYRINSNLPRATSLAVYQQIIVDLKDAEGLLSNGYVASDAKSTTQERLRPNKWAAAALLARAYLFSGKYDSAEIEATKVINNTSTYDTVPLNKVFLKNSKEAIWQLQPVNAGWNTEDARVFILPFSGPTNSSGAGYPVYLSLQLLGSFETNDQRRINWIDSVIVNGEAYFYPYKYKSASLNASVTEYLMVLRLSEQYLIRAEARAQQNKISGGQSDLEVIRSRARLLTPTFNDQASILSAIQHERQIEFFTEWGHRWLDMKRTGTVTDVMSNVTVDKGTSWDSNWQWWPLPSYDIVQDPNLIQNHGY